MGINTPPVTLNVLLGSFGLGLAIANFASILFLRRGRMQAFFAIAWAVFVVWLVFLVPHVSNDIFGGVFTLLVSAWYLFKTISPKFAYPVSAKLNRWLYGKQLAARIDLANERMANRYEEAKRRNISVTEVMRDERPMHRP